MRTPDQHHLVGTDHGLAGAALLHPHRGGPSRRGHELPLPAAGRIRRRSARPGRGRGARVDRDRRARGAGATWTTDAPYRETEQAIGAARAQGILAVEMEAAALYAFAQARGKPVLCFAHVTNQMGQAGDFEEGEANGATTALRLVAAVAAARFPI
ncbi:hypothetical protein R1A27_14385 [Methylobacterium sp. NMS12]